jgi:regulatory protein
VAPKSCHERALGLLAVRPRTRTELSQRLRRAGFDADEVDAELARLERVGLIDDAAFAERFAEQRFDVKRSGSRSVASELRAKGVSAEIVAAVTGPEAERDEARAEDLALSALSRMSGLDASRAFRRVDSLLVRRGYAPDVARRAARKALEADRCDGLDLA